MAEMTATVAGERYGDQVTLVASHGSVVGNGFDTVKLPALFGDCLLLELLIDWDTISAAGTASGGGWPFGSAAYIVDQAATPVVRDMIGAAPIWQMDNGVGSLKATCNIDPDQPVMWRQGESVKFFQPAIDTADNFDVSVTIRVKRLRNTGKPS